jgi:hypothetical protein
MWIVAGLAPAAAFLARKFGRRVPEGATTRRLLAPILLVAALAVALAQTPTSAEHRHHPRLVTFLRDKSILLDQARRDRCGELCFTLRDHGLEMLQCQAHRGRISKWSVYRISRTVASTCSRRDSSTDEPPSGVNGKVRTGSARACCGAQRCGHLKQVAVAAGVETGAPLVEWRSGSV